jgi:hypothetical protein
LTDRDEREIEWEKLTRCVSEFEALGNAIRIHLLRLPQTPKRKSDLSQLSFQRVINAAERIKEWFGFDYLEGISTEDMRFVSIMFNKRHVFTHNAGRVDQEYIDNTGDTSVKINQVLRLRSKEIRRLLPLMRVISLNFVNGFSSIK